MLSENDQLWSSNGPLVCGRIYHSTSSLITFRQQQTLLRYIIFLFIKATLWYFRLDSSQSDHISSFFFFFCSFLICFTIFKQYRFDIDTGCAIQTHVFIMFITIEHLSKFTFLFHTFDFFLLFLLQKRQTSTKSAKSKSTNHLWHDFTSRQT